MKSTYCFYVHQFNDRTDVHKNEKLLKVRPITTVTRKQEKIQSVLYEVTILIAMLLIYSCINLI